MQAELRLRVSKVHYVSTVFIHREVFLWRKDTQNFGNFKIYCRYFANRAVAVDAVAVLLVMVILHTDMVDMDMATVLLLC